MSVAPATISNWENNRRTIGSDERPVLMTLVVTLHKYGGLATLGEVNELLHAGGYQGLTQDEQIQFLPALAVEEKDTMLTQSQLHHRLAKSTVAAIFTGPDWPEDDSRLAAAVLHLLGAPFNNFTPAQGLRLISMLMLWIFSAAIWSQALVWPFLSQGAMLQAWILWGGMTVVAPLLLGQIIKADRQNNLVETTGAKWSIALVRTTGALAGYQVGAGMILLAVLALFYLGLLPRSQWLMAGLAGLPLVIGYAAARRMPLIHFRVFSKYHDAEEAFHLEDGDWAMFFAFFILGPALAVMFVVGQPWSWPPLVGAAMLGIVFMGVAALHLLAGRLGEKFVPAEAWALLLGVPLGLQMAIQPGAEPLLGLGLIAGLVVLAVGLRRRKETPSFVQMISFLGILVGIGVLLQVNVWAGRAGALIGAWVAWRWLGDLFRQMAGFWLVVLLLVGCLVLLEMTDLPAWVIRGGFGVGVVGVGVWEVRRGEDSRTRER
ncbi:MAG: hypothetical protein KBG20_10280 [Caldilineaceae bacterium]|nr:hypothetical protein [Caldilineaceae bacterium]MBP8122321.1 hypothetical protein [Caldilineaceae bacterium]MBP9072679.1 hypothetical protein [Caldilineaceae bacterium]